MGEPTTRTSYAPQPGFASRQDRTPLQREIQRRIMLALPPLRRLGARLREVRRRALGAPHVIDFFHQLDDAYSHLALQAIAELALLYDVELRFHLVSQADRIHAPEPTLLAAYARRDCAAIAPHYGLDFPAEAAAPKPDSEARVARLLAGLTRNPRFLEVALEAGRALWKHDTTSLDRLSDRLSEGSALPAEATEAETAARIAEGNALRRRKGHYSGGLFRYAGEWYWGVDRLHHLERRLIALGAARSARTKPRFDRPPLDPGTDQNEGRLTLEIFPSLRSPYTAMIFDRSLALAESVDVPVTLRPVMPMVMRGVPAPRAKGLYIMLDALREAQHIGVPFGNMYDPIGRPVERGFSLWPFARERGRGAEFISCFLRAAFVEGQPTGTDEGLRAVVEAAGLSFEDAQGELDGEDWREELEANRQTMYDELGIWGVPSYRLRGPAGEPDLCVWGQDRLWLVAAEIRRRLGEPSAPTS